MKGRGLDLPFIVVSGAVGEEKMVELMRIGAHDVVLKDNLARLVPSIERELSEATVRRERQHAEEALREAHEKLEQRVEERTSELNQEIQQRIEAEVTLRESEERFRDFATVASDYFFEMDENLRYSFVSERYEEITGLPPADVIGKSNEEIWTGLSLESDWREDGNWQERQAALKSHRSYSNIRQAWTRPDGNRRTLLVAGKPIFGEDGRFLGYRCVGSDITGLSAAENAAVAARIVAEKANHAKSDFLSSMSHELRTPMNAILGFGQLLELSLKEPLTKTQKDYVGYILKSGQHLLELINDVLDLTKIEAGKVELSIEDVCPRDVLDECLALVHSMADERGIGIVVGEGFKAAAKIRADQTRFKQSLLNLMSNAIKYNRERGKVTVDCHETPGGMLHVSVTDEGEGISEDMRRDLFEPFHRLGLETTKIEGTGIGLTITKQIIERMGGHIGVYTEIGKGSTFWIELPLAEGKPIDEAVADRETVDDKAEPLPDVTGTVLYVEDNPASLDLMEVIVARIEGLSMISAHNAELGIELAKSKTPDLIILDIDLPGMDGLEALGKLQRLEETKDIPVIALSANATPKDIEKGVEAGFKRYLTKPIEVEEVVKSIKDGLEN